MMDKDKALVEFSRLIGIMERLRGPEGCEWDRAQTFASIVPYTLEEAHEVADAVARNDMDDLCEELGDLLLQVIFHAQMAAEGDHFTLADVARGICDKMERRHPHIFRSHIPLCAEEVKANWETIKAAEKPRKSALDGIALTLPALTRAEKLSARAARTGFDWPDAGGPLEKIQEELAELAEAATDAHRTEEAGDLLFAASNYLRKLNIDPENALRQANRKFEARFRAIETTPGFAKMSLSEQEKLWQKQKNAESERDDAGDGDIRGI